MGWKGWFCLRVHHHLAADGLCTVVYSPSVQVRSQQMSLPHARRWNTDTQDRQTTLARSTSYCTDVLALEESREPQHLKNYSQDRDESLATQLRAPIGVSSFEAACFVVLGGESCYTEFVPSGLHNLPLPVASIRRLSRRALCLWTLLIRKR